MKFKIIKQLLLNYINTDQFKIDDALPSEIDLSKIFNVSRGTIRKSIEELKSEGILIKKHGSGTFINKKKIISTINHLVSYSEEISSINKVPSNKIINFSMINTPLSIVSKLHILPNSKVYHTIMLRFIDNDPISKEESFISVDKFPDLSIKDIEKSKFLFFENTYNYKILGSHKIFNPILSDQITAKLLKIDIGTPLLQIIAQDIDINNEPLCLSMSSINTKKHNAKYFIKR